MCGVFLNSTTGDGVERLRCRNAIGLSHSVGFIPIQELLHFSA